MPVSITGSRYREIIRIFCLLRSESDGQVILLGLCTLLVVVVSGALAALSPLVLKTLVDAVAVPNPSRPAVAMIGVGYLFLLLAARALGDVRPLLGGTLNQRLHSRLTRRFFHHAARLPMAYLLKRRSSELLHCLDLASAGAQLVMTHLVASLLPVLVELFTMTAVLLHLQQPALVEVLGAAALAYLAIFTAGARRMTKAAHSVSAGSLDVAAQLGDCVAHIETLRCFAAESEVSQRLAEVSVELERRWLTLNRSNLAISLEASAIFALAMSACLYIGASAVGAGTMTVGSFVLITMYTLQMVRPLESLGSAARDFARALGYLHPLVDMLSVPLAPSEIGVAGKARAGAPTSSRGLAVRFENLHFAYEPQRPILVGLEFDVPAGTMTAIVGRSGSGKSSLARLLMRLYMPQQGRILLDGRGIESIPVGELRGCLVGLVTQETALLHDTIARNIALGTPTANKEDIRQAAYAAQLADLIATLPQGLDTPVGERGMQLSGGERQRVGIARVLLRRPGLYVLDEPTSALDSTTECEILQALRSHSSGATMIVIAHRLSTIVSADEILVLHDGRICERGRHDFLLAMQGRYAEMWRQQAVEPL